MEEEVYELCNLFSVNTRTKMKIVFLTNNEVSKGLIDWLRNEAKEEVIVVSNKISKDDILSWKPDFLISYNYRYIIKREVLNLLPGKAINLHISFLSWNKGAHPNVWSFLEDTPKGVTIQLIDKGLDTGDILVQKEVFIDETKETLKSSYEILHYEIQKLFRSYWRSIKKGKIKPKKQKEGGSLHYKRDLEKLEPILKEKGWDTPIWELKEKYKSFKEN